MIGARQLEIGIQDIVCRAADAEKRGAILVQIHFARVVVTIAVRVGPLVQSCRRDIPVCLLDDVDVPHIREPSPSPFDNEFAGSPAMTASGMAGHFILKNTIG